MSFLAEHAAASKQSVDSTQNKMCGQSWTTISVFWNPGNNAGTMLGHNVFLKNEHTVWARLDHDFLSKNITPHCLHEPIVHRIAFKKFIRRCAHAHCNPQPQQSLAVNCDITLCPISARQPAAEVVYDFFSARGLLTGIKDIPSGGHCRTAFSINLRSSRQEWNQTRMER